MASPSGDIVFGEMLLTSTAVQQILVSGETVAILYSPSAEDENHIQLSICTVCTVAEKRNMIHWRTRLNGLSDAHLDMKIMISTNTDHLVLFEYVFIEKGYQEFHFTRFDSNGQFHSRGSLKATDTFNLWKLLEPSTPSDVNGCATVWSYYLLDVLTESGNPYKTLTQVQYDPQRNKLQLKTNQMAEVSRPKRLFFWKDVAYHSDHSHSTTIVDLSDNKTSSAATMCRSVYQDSWTPFNLGTELEICMFGDEDFLVIPCYSGFLTWCFNKDIKMHNEEDNYYAIHHQREIENGRELRRDRETKAIAHVSRQEEINLDVIGSVGSYHEFHKRQSEIESGDQAVL